MSINFNQLGLRMDGWADVVRDCGEKADEARGHLERIVRERDMPTTTVDSTTVSSTLLGARQRPYLHIATPTGASVVVYLGAYGKDLYATWESYLRPVLNQSVLAWIAIIAGVGALLGNYGSRTAYSDGGLNVLGWILGTITYSIGLAIIVGLAGLAMRGNPLAFFYKQLDKFDLDDIGALTLIAHRSLLEALDSVGIHSQQLRLKEQFRAGSRERLI